MSDERDIEKEIEKKSKEILEEIKSDLLKSEEGQRAFHEAKEILLDILETWSRAKSLSLLGSEEDKRIARISIKYSHQSLVDIKDALSSKMSNYLLDKFIESLRSILIKIILPSVL